MTNQESIDNFWLGSVSPFQGVLYAGNMLPGGTLMKWSGTQFERPSPDEANRFYANAANLPAGPSYDNVEGWSKRTAAGEVTSESPTKFQEKDAKVTVQLGGSRSHS